MILGVNKVGPDTGVRMASSAVRVISFCMANSCSGERRGLPQGWGIWVPVTERGTPSCLLKAYMAVIIAVGRPALSSSLVIAAPLREHDPQVLTITAACTPSAFICWAISCPICFMVLTEAWTPGVT